MLAGACAPIKGRRPFSFAAVRREGWRGCGYIEGREDAPRRFMHLILRTGSRGPLCAMLCPLDRVGEYLVEIYRIILVKGDGGGWNKFIR